MVSAVISMLLSIGWYMYTGGSLSLDAYKWLTTASATLAGFVFTTEQLLMIILGNENSRVGKIIREENPGYADELLKVTEVSVLGYFLTAVIGGFSLLMGRTLLFLSFILVLLVALSSVLLFLLILNVQLLYEDYLELDLKGKRSEKAL